VADYLPVRINIMLSVLHGVTEIACEWYHASGNKYSTRHRASTSMYQCYFSYGFSVTVTEFCDFSVML